MKISRQPKKWKEKTWTMHSLKEIVAFFKRESAIILGAMHVEKQVSDKDKWKRKKYETEGTSKTIPETQQP